MMEERSRTACSRGVPAGRQPVTPAMALGIGELCGNGPELWIRMQAAHDLHRAEQEVDLSAIPTLTAAE